MVRPLKTESSWRFAEIGLALPLVLRKSHFVYGQETQAKKLKEEAKSRDFFAW